MDYVTSYAGSEHFCNSLCREVAQNSGLLSVVISRRAVDVGTLVGALGLDYMSSEWIVRDPTLSSTWDLDAEIDTLWWNDYVLVCDSLVEVREYLAMFESHGRARRCTLVIANPLQDEKDIVWTTRRLRMQARRIGHEMPGIGFTASITGDKWVSVRRGISAAISEYPLEASSLPLNGLRVGITDPSLRHWVAGDQYSQFMTYKSLNPEPSDIYSVDIILGTNSLPSGVNENRVLPVLVPTVEGELPPVDFATISARGFRPYSTELIAEVPKEILAAGGTLGERQLQDLRRYKYLTLAGGDADGDSQQLARVISQFAAAGVPLLMSNISTSVVSLLGNDVADAVLSYERGDTMLTRESKSITLRRLAFERFSSIATYGRILPEGVFKSTEIPSVSIILCTRRPSNVKFALEQIARQSWSQLEIVLVMHGFDRNEAAVADAIDSYPGKIVECSLHGSTVFGQALNAGVSMSSGQLVTKMDDDDWYGPNHVKDLVYAKLQSRAMLVGAQVEFVYLENIDVTTRRTPAGDRFSDHVAGGTMMISAADLAQIGGWRPVHRAVDRCLLQAVEASGGAIYRSHGQNYMMQRHTIRQSHGGHTWNPGESVFLNDAVEQWNGFCPPPQIGTSNLMSVEGRNISFMSYFSPEYKGVNAG